MTFFVPDLPENPNLEIYLDWVINDEPRRGQMIQCGYFPLQVRSASEIEKGGLEPVVSQIDDIDGCADALIHWANYMKLGLLGEGSSRIVYKLDKDHAIKIALNAKGVAQNKVESHLAQKFHDLPITQVHYCNPTARYLVVDFAHELNLDTFERKFGISFYFFGKICRRFDSNRATRESKRKDWNEFSKPAKELAYSLIRHGILLGDVGGIGQWGEIHNDPVLVDYGLNKDVYERLYKNSAILKVSKILIGYEI